MDLAIYIYLKFSTKKNLFTKSKYQNTKLCSIIIMNYRHVLIAANDLKLYNEKTQIDVYFISKCRTFVLLIHVKYLGLQGCNNF